LRCCAPDAYPHPLQCVRDSVCARYRSIGPFPHIGPCNACPRAAPETTPLWRLFLINLSLSLLPPPHPEHGPVELYMVLNVIYVCIHRHRQTDTHAYINVYTHIHTYSGVCVCVRACVCTRGGVHGVQIHSIVTRNALPAHISCICVCVCVCVSVCVCVCVCTCIYVHMLPASMYLCVRV